MDKTQLKTVITSLSAGDKVTVNFAGAQASSSGSYKVLGTKRGRGKGGCLLVNLQAADGSLLTTGTPQSAEIVNLVTSDGTVHGLTDASQVVQVYTTDLSRAVALKEQFKTFLTAEGNVNIEVVSSEPEYNGIFKIQSSRQVRGRFGQIILNLEATDGSMHELWSYRHSGIVTRITVID